MLKIDIETVNKYILERPLDFLQLEPNMIFGLIDKKGFFDKSVLTKFCSPLLKAQNLDIDITMQELYNFSNIEFNIIFILLWKIIKSFTIKLETVQTSRKWKRKWQIENSLFSKMFYQNIIVVEAATF